MASPDIWKSKQKLVAYETDENPAPHLICGEAIYYSMGCALLDMGS